MPVLLLVFLVAAAAEEGFSLFLLRRQARAARAGRDHVPEAFRDTVTADEHRRAAAYTVARARVASVGGLLSFGMTVWLACTGADAIAGLAGRALAAGLWRDLAVLGGIALAAAIPGIAVSAWRRFVLEARFGFNRTTPGLFMADRARGAALAVAIGGPLLAAVLLAMRDAGPFWWCWTWAGGVVLMLASPAISTRVVMPLFNRFARLEDRALAERIEHLLARCGFQSSGLWTMDASRRSSHGNAFFVGWGRSKRIVLFDTLLAGRTPDEVEAVVAHELGHFHHRHVVFGLVRGAALLFVVLGAIGWLARAPWLLPGFGWHNADAALSLFAANLLVGLAMPALTPLGNAVSRRHEYEADEFARRAVGAAPMISALVGLTRDSAQTLTPDPLYSLVHHSHPPVPLRVARLRASER